MRHTPWSIPVLLALAVPLALAQAPAGEKKREDDAVIRLNEKDPTLNDWKKLRDTSKDPKREPGPIYINRQWAGGWLGIPTFFGMPVALNPEDLKAGKVDVAIMGAPLDTGSGMKGAAFGPRALRTSEKYLGSGPEDADPHLHVMVNWNADLKVVDYGDSPIDYLSGERSMQPIREMVRDVAKTGTIPFIVGGDHSLEYPNVAGIADVYGKENVGVIHFDSHYDAGKGFAGHLISHGRPIRAAHQRGPRARQELHPGRAAGLLAGEDGFRWMREQGFRYHTMAEIERDGWPAVMKRVLEEANDGPKHLYISLDIDVLDPSYAPGTGTPRAGRSHHARALPAGPRALHREEPGGLRPRGVESPRGPGVHDRLEREPADPGMPDRHRHAQEGHHAAGLPEPAHRRARSPEAELRESGLAADPASGRFRVAALALFAVAGIAIAAVQWHRSRRDAIVATSEVVSDLEEERRALLGRALTDVERQRLLEDWVDQEVLVREAYRRGLDRGDGVIRHRLVEKMRALLAEKRKEPSREELLAFHLEHEERYRSPARVSLEHVFVGKSDEAARSSRGPPAAAPGRGRLPADGRAVLAGADARDGVARGAGPRAWGRLREGRLRPRARRLDGPPRVHPWPASRAREGAAALGGRALRSRGRSGAGRLVRVVGAGDATAPHRRVEAALPDRGGSRLRDQLSRIAFLTAATAAEAVFTRLLRPGP